MNAILATAACAALVLTGLPDASAAGEAPRWMVDSMKSRLDFSVGVSGTQADGHFGEWTADIAFDPAVPTGGKLVVNVTSGSVEIGLSQARKLITQPDWLATEAYPQARFQSDRMTWQNGMLQIDGVLTLRGQTGAVSLLGPMTINGNRAVADVMGEISRVDFGILASPEAVAPTVTISAHIEADRAP